MLVSGQPCPMKSNLPPPASGQQRGQRLLFVAVFFAVLLNYPLLAAFDHAGRVAGVPTLYLYILLTWLLLIGLTGWLVRNK